MGIRGELYTNQVNLDNRSYFFNVKENRNGDVFLQIVESKIKDGLDDRRAIVVFADDMQKFLGGMDESLKFIDKDRKEKAKLRAEKKAEKDARYAAGAADGLGGKKIYRRKGESRLVAERRSERQDDGIKRTGRVIHVTSKRSPAAPEQQPADEY
ncbi:MAG TPA: DNA-binding protein [Treponema sp.]|nr:DNA-binding protein [Treponema sp.]